MFPELRKVMDSETFSTIIKERVNVSIGDIYVMLLKYALTNFLSQAATENLFKMINCLYDRPVIAETRYLIDKLFNPSSTIQYHAQCSSCKQITQFKSLSDKIICKSCTMEINMKDRDFFITLNIAHEIASCLEKYGVHYKYVVDERKHTKHIYSDIYDGSEYRKFLGMLPATHRHSYATLTFNADDAPVFKSSNTSIWPIQIMINELPIHVRTHHPLLGALWFGKSKPDMNVFLTPFVKNMNILSTSGIMCNFQGGKINVKVYALNCCVDSQARAPMQGINQFNGYYGCNWCLHPGEWVKRNNNARGSVKYPNISAYVPELRNKEDTVFVMDSLNCEASDNESDIELEPDRYGIKSRTPLCDLELFNIINGFVPDYLHCCLLGIGKQFLNYWRNTTDRLFSFTANDERIINAHMKYIRVPHQVSRLVRTLEDQSYWKAREYENWILYYSLPLLSLTSLPDTYVSHWALFVEALHLLLQSNMTLDDIRTANNLLHQFVHETEKLYTKNAMTFNVHQLTHLAKSVKEWGPLWAHSSFGFESGNFYLLKMIKAAKGVNQQVCRNLFMSKAVELILSEKGDILSPQVHKFCLNLESKTVQKTLAVTSKIRYFSETSSAKLLNIALKLGLEPTKISFFTKMIKDQCAYLTFKKNNKRSDNSFAVLEDGSFIQIESFIVHRGTNRELTLCKRIIVNNLSVSRVEVIKIRTKCDVIDTKTIKSICVFINLPEIQYLCNLPNLLFY